jgi:hypothetical protein
LTTVCNPREKGKQKLNSSNKPNKERGRERRNNREKFLKQDLWRCKLRWKTTEDRPKESQKENAEAQAVIIITLRFAMLCSHDPCLQLLGTHPKAH